MFHTDIYKDFVEYHETMKARFGLLSVLRRSKQKQEVLQKQTRIFEIFFVYVEYFSTYVFVLNGLILNYSSGSMNQVKI